jgi:tRNA (guanine26-N2/guanine27-N2)-dimethyltransferase
MSLSGTRKIVEKTVPEGFKLITEGTAKLLHSTKNEVFYNNVQVFNRDMSTLAIQMFLDKNPCKEGATLLEALSASGLRSIRYFKEIEGLKQIIANDLSLDAVDEIKRNLEYNEVSEKDVIPNHGDAIVYMQQNVGKFEIVDLDPYGSASPFLDSALSSLKDKGLLCVTCTDMAVLAGGQIGACYAKYGSIPFKSPACHEMGLRILLASINQIASKKGKFIVPLMSCSIDFYCRIFLQVFNSQNEAKNALTKSSHVLKCSSCDYIDFIPLATVKKGKYVIPDLDHNAKCTVCSGKIKIAGPIWSEPIHNTEFVTSALDRVTKEKLNFATSTRMIGFLTVISKEIARSPLYYDVPTITSHLKLAAPKISLIRSVIANAGYLVSQSHCNQDALKTTAPISFIYSAFVQNHINSKTGQTPAPGSLLEKFMKDPNPPTLDFTLRQEMLLNSRESGVAKFMPNPEPNWGPKPRAQNKRKNEEPENPSKELKKGE